MTTLTPTDTTTWLPLDGLAPGFGANKAPHSTALAGRTLTTVDDHGVRVAHTFTEHTVTWAYGPGAGDAAAAAPATDDYEAFEVDDELTFVQFHRHARPNEAVSLVLDLRAGRALSVVQTLGDAAPGRTAVQQAFAASVIEELETSGRPAAPTISLIGRRVMWVYSTEHAYEHVYLSPQWYTWQCLAGPERGLADTDEHTTFEVRPGIHVFAWREKVIPCGSVTIADHRDARAIRSHGVLFGENETGDGWTHFTFGAHGRLVSTTVHPDEYDPAR